MLRAVYIKGFKTFAQPVRMPLEAGITSIIGPNGSGKSNITDAVAWALGEQRPAALRAETMGDVIFSGSETVNGARVAEVTLVLDNRAGEISLPYEEVAVTRRLDSGGESEYRINGARSRLQDVRAIAGEAGIGQHSILRQGAVDAIVSGGAEACRNALEEAAGLGVFRRRRKAAGRRLERADERLERSRELEREMSERLRQIEREALAAREYRELEARLRRLSLAHLYRTANRGVEEREREFRERNTRVAELFERAEKLRSRRAELDGAVHSCAQRLREVESPVQRLERVWAAANREVVRGERLSARYAAADSQRESRRRALSRLISERESAIRSAESLEVRLDELEKTHTRQRETLAESETAAREARNHSAAANADRERLEQESSRLHSRRERLSQLTGSGPSPGLSAVTLERLLELRSPLREAAEGRGEERTAGLRDRLSAPRERSRALAADLNRRRGALAALAGEAEASLRALSGPEESDGERLQDSIQALPGYEAALEAALGELARGRLVSDVAGGERALLSGERVVVRQDAEESGVPEAGPGRPLADCVRVLNPVHEPLVRRWLAGIFVVESFEPELRLNGYTAVTRRGLRLTRTSMSRRVEEGEFSRRARAESEEARLEALQGKLSGRLESLQRAVRRIEGRLQNFSETAEGLSGVHHRLWRAADRAGTRLDERLRRLEEERERSRRASEELGSVEAELAGNERDRGETRASAQRLEAESRTAESAVEAAREAAQASGAQLSEARYRREQAHRRGRSLGERVERLQGALQSEPERLQTIARRTLEAGESLTGQLSDRLDSLRERRDGLSADQARLAAERDGLSQDSLSVTEELAEARSSAERLQESLSRLREDSEAARAEISEEWAATVEEAREESESLPENIEKERREANRKINRFGDVNLLAIAQEDEVRERYEFVSGQRADAEAAAAELNRIIQEIDEQLEERFTRTFERIRASFKEIIPRMLAEAEGELELTEEGVEIGIRLKRKGRRSLQVLSGGERSLLALSYLFSIFLARSGAFCILDEAEAALDDLNLARFLAVVDSYRSEGQFVLVTHQKRTMAAADVLYGVAVDASGASTMVSKRLSGLSEEEVGAEA